jgi:CHAT domain-containing protein
LALESGDPAEVFEWCERWRARSLWPPEVVPPADPVLAERLAQLRHTVAALELAVQAGDATDELASRRQALESGIRRRSLEAPLQPRSSPAIPTLAEVQASLTSSNAAALVELLSVRGQLHAVVCTQDECTVRVLAPVPEVERSLATLRFALGRLVLGRGSEASLQAAAELLLRSAEQIDALVLGPISDLLRSAATVERAETVLVPTGGLHSMPWGLLGSLQGMPISVVPSAALFTNRSSARRLTGATVLVAGPGVASATQEVDAIGRLYEHAVTLRGRLAIARDVASAMAGARIAHIVAHGRFRTDNALFSALELADGPLTVYDLERIGQAPELLVLSACDAGRSDVQPGDELIGMAAAMLSLGSRAIVASVAPVPDAGAPQVMVHFHQLLLMGHTPCAALALTQSAYQFTGFEPGDIAGRSSEVLAALAASGLVCFGAGGFGPEAAPAQDPGRPRVRADRLAAKITK